MSQASSTSIRSRTLSQLARGSVGNLLISPGLLSPRRLWNDFCLFVYIFSIVPEFHGLTLILNSGWIFPLTSLQFQFGETYWPSTSDVLWWPQWPEQQVLPPYVQTGQNQVIFKRTVYLIRCIFQTLERKHTSRSPKCHNLITKLETNYLYCSLLNKSNHITVTGH